MNGLAFLLPPFAPHAPLFIKNHRGIGDQIQHGTEVMTREMLLKSRKQPIPEFYINLECRAEESFLYSRCSFCYSAGQGENSR